MPGTCVPWKLGVEVELLAPVGQSRKDLAIAIADYYDAKVRRIFYPQGEPSKVPGMPIFENLTLGYVVEDNQGNILAKCVDDLTLQEDLNRKELPKPGWYRIVSDDSRLLRLTMRHADPESSLQSVLKPIADIFQTTIEKGENGMLRVSDEANAPIAIAAPLPGERERPCELITPPMESDHLDQLEILLNLARSLNFQIPAEGAIHLHFDADKLCNAVTVANLVNILQTHGSAIKTHFATNPRCQRLGSWPDSLSELVNSESFIKLPWHDARKQLVKLKLTKYCDYNLNNFVHPVPDKYTFEIRILPVWLSAGKIVEAALFFTAILQWANDSEGQLKTAPVEFKELLQLEIGS